MKSDTIVLRFVMRYPVQGLLGEPSASRDWKVAGALVGGTSTVPATGSDLALGGESHCRLQLASPEGVKRRLPIAWHPLQHH